MLLVRQSFSTNASLLTKYMEQDVPTVWVNVAGFTVCGLYRQWTPNALSSTSATETESALNFQKRQMNSILQQLSAAASQERDPMVILGDTNLDFSRLDSPPTSKYPHLGMLQELKVTTEQLDMRWLKTEHTWQSYGKHDGVHRKSTLDVILASNRIPSDGAVLLSSAASDHLPVMSEMLPPKEKGRASILRPVKKEKLNRRPFHKLTSEGLLQALDTVWDWDVHAREWTVNSLAEYIRDGINAALDVVCPAKELLVRRGSSVFLSGETREIMKQRDLARRLHLPSYPRLRNRAAAAVKRDKLKTTLKDVAKRGQEAVWSLVRSLSGAAPDSLPLLGEAKSDEESADLCNEFYIAKVEKIREEIAERLTKGRPKRSVENVAMSTDEPSNEAAGSSKNFSFSGVSAGKIAKLIKGLKAKKSYGLDGIPASVFKLGADVLASPIAHLCTLSLVRGEYPEYFGDAVLRPLHKGGGKSHTDPASYRPVALLPVMSKLLERAALEQMLGFFKETGAVPDAQHGFRAGRSTISAMATAHAAWTRRKGKFLAISTYDMSSAFDTVDPANLLIELQGLGFGKDALTWVRSYLGAGSQVVEWNGKRSARLLNKYGVKQGSILAPVFFIIISRNLPALFLAALAYADDITSWAEAESLEELQNLVESQAESFLEASAKLGLKANPDKTQVMIVGPGKDAIASSSFLIGGERVSPVPEIEVLGMAVAQNLALNRERDCTDVRRRIGVVSRLSNHIPRGRPLTMVAKALVLGKLHASLPMSAKPRLEEAEPEDAMSKKMRVAVNDLARVLKGAKRTDKIPTQTLLTKSKLTSYNRMSVQRCAVEAWKAARSPDSATATLMQAAQAAAETSRTTRSVSSGLMRVPEPSKGASLEFHAPRIWNRAPLLRAAKTLGEARTAARKFAQTCPL